MKDYDLVVLGSGPAGEKAAVKAAYFGYRVAVVDPCPQPGLAGAQSSLLPSNALREAALYYSGVNDKGLFGVDRKLERQSSIEDFFYRKNLVLDTQTEAVVSNFDRHKVDVFRGNGRFVDPKTIQVWGGKEEQIRSEWVLIATGSRPARPEGIPFDGKRVHDPESILKLDRFPSSIAIAGAGVHGCEYASIFAALGIPVYLINRKEAVLPFMDSELTDALMKSMRTNGVEVITNSDAEAFEAPEDPDAPLRIPLKTGEVLNVDMFLYTEGRRGNTDDLGCTEQGIQLNPQGAIEVDQHFRTSLKNVYAVGDVIDLPSPPSTSMDQGRVAVAHIFNIGDTPALAELYPRAVYTIPELSSVGLTEKQAESKGIEHCVGRAFYKDMARGKIHGDQDGFLKLVFDRNSLEVVGVHVIGRIASELVHYGVGLVENKKTVKDVIASTFNFPTLHDLYKYAAYDGLGNWSGHKVR